MQQRKKCLLIKHNDTEQLISLKKISSILVTKTCFITTDLLQLAAENNIQVLICDRYGRNKVRTIGNYFGQDAALRRKQTFWQLSTHATNWVIELFEQKCQHQIQTLKHVYTQSNSDEATLNSVLQTINSLLPNLSNYKQQTIAQCRNNLMGIEGTIARCYWQAISPCLPIKYQYAKRSRQPATDPFNAILNYLYGITYSLVENAALAAHLDPYLGILHADEWAARTLTFDLIEPFRPWIDQLLIDWCLTEKIKAEHTCFKLDDNNNIVACTLTNTGKALVIPAFYDYINIEKKRFMAKELSIKTHIYRFAGTFAQKIKLFDCTNIAIQQLPPPPPETPNTTA